jgi:hypothetical protein
MPPELLPPFFRGRDNYELVIPTVCNLSNMLNKLESVKGDTTQLESWHLRSYKAYNIEAYQNQIMGQPDQVKKTKIRDHILQNFPANFGANCMDIYLVGYVAHTVEPGQDAFFHYLLNHGITKKTNSMKAIWQVGKGDGIFLNILNKDGSIGDWDFVKAWINPPQA